MIIPIASAPPEIAECNVASSKTLFVARTINAPIPSWSLSASSVLEVTSAVALAKAVLTISAPPTARLVPLPSTLLPLDAFTDKSPIDVNCAFSVAITSIPASAATADISIRDFASESTRLRTTAPPNATASVFSKLKSRGTIEVSKTSFHRSLLLKSTSVHVTVVLFAPK